MVEHRYPHLMILQLPPHNPEGVVYKVMIYVDLKTNGIKRQCHDKILPICIFMKILANVLYFLLETHDFPFITNFHLD